MKTKPASEASTVKQLWHKLINREVHSFHVECKSVEDVKNSLKRVAINNSKLYRQIYMINIHDGTHFYITVVHKSMFPTVSCEGYIKNENNCCSINITLNFTLGSYILHLLLFVFATLYLIYELARGGNAIAAFFMVAFSLYFMLLIRFRVVAQKELVLDIQKNFEIVPDVKV